MRGYQIFIKTENNTWRYFGKTPISAQANEIRYRLEQSGHIVKVRNLAACEEF